MSILVTHNKLKHNNTYDKKNILLQLCLISVVIVIGF